MSFQEAKRSLIIFFFTDDLKLYSRIEEELDSLVQIISIFSRNMGMEFGIKKCEMLLIERGKIVESVGIEIPDSKVIKQWQIQEGGGVECTGGTRSPFFLQSLFIQNGTKNCVTQS